MNGRVGSGSSGSANTDVEEGEEMEEGEEGEDDAGGAAHSSNRLTSDALCQSRQSKRLGWIYKPISPCF